MMACGTVTPFSGFDAEADCKKLRNAMKGAGTDEKAIIGVICYRSNKQRQEIKSKFKSMYGRDIVDELKSELSGDFEKVMIGLMMTHDEYDAYSIKRAVKGLGTDEAALIEILCSRNNEEIEAMKSCYYTLYKKKMEDAVASDLSGDLRRLMVSLIQANREPDGKVDMQKVSHDAKELYKAGEGQLGTDEESFNAILCTRSYSHLRAMYAEYEKISKVSFDTAIKKELSGDLRKAYLAIYEVSKDRVSFFSNQLYKAMKGLGTDEDTLTRIMVSRCEVDLVQVKQTFASTYGKSLYSFISNDTSGDYRNALLALCKD